MKLFKIEKVGYFSNQWSIKKSFLKHLKRSIAPQAAPPRQVIIERVPPPPPKPRAIV
jgi:hypothetical protein